MEVGTLEQTIGSNQMALALARARYRRGNLPVRNADERKRPPLCGSARVVKKKNGAAFQVGLRSGVLRICK